MTQPVIHHMRLAWDGARVFVRAMDDDRVCAWLGEALGELYGASCRQALSESQYRLWSSGRTDAPHVESGLWRARLEDLLRADPASAESLLALTLAASRRLEDALPAQFRPSTARPSTVDSTQ